MCLRDVLCQTGEVPTHTHSNDSCCLLMLPCYLKGEKRLYFTSTQNPSVFLFHVDAGRQRDYPGSPTWLCNPVNFFLSNCAQ